MGIFQKELIFTFKIISVFAFQYEFSPECKKPVSEASNSWQGVSLVPSISEHHLLLPGKTASLKLEHKPKISAFSVISN